MSWLSGLKRLSRKLTAGSKDTRHIRRILSVRSGNVATIVFLQLQLIDNVTFGTEESHGQQNHVTLEQLEKKEKQAIPFEINEGRKPYNKIVK